MKAGNEAKETFVMVLSENKSDLEGMTLKKHHKITRDHMLKKMKNSSASASEEVTIDGHSALQDELRGTQAGINVVFLHTTVEDDENFQQILAWTTKSRWDQEKDELQEVTGTFRSEN